MKKIYLLISVFLLITSVSIENAIAMKRLGKSYHKIGSQKRQCKTLENAKPQTILPEAPVVMVDAQTQTAETTQLEASVHQNPSQITTFVGPTSFVDWLQAEWIIEWLKREGINDCTNQKILSSVFEQIIKLIITLTDDTGDIIKSVNVNNEPLEIRPLLGTGAINKEINPLLYLIRIDKYCPCTPSYHVVALIYLQRLIKKHTPNILNNISFYRTYLAAFIVASKWLEDKVYTLPYYAQVGGIPKAELISIEA